MMQNNILVRFLNPFCEIRAAFEKFFLPAHLAIHMFLFLERYSLILATPCFDTSQCGRNDAAPRRKSGPQVC